MHLLLVALCNFHVTAHYPMYFYSITLTHTSLIIHLFSSFACRNCRKNKSSMVRNRRRLMNERKSHGIKLPKNFSKIKTQTKLTVKGSWKSRHTLNLIHISSMFKVLPVTYVTLMCLGDTCLCSTYEFILFL